MRCFRIYQLKILKEKSTALLDLNPCFYPKKAVGIAAKAFKGVCSAKMQLNGNRLLVELKFPKGSDAEEIALNFANHALSASRGLL